MSTGMWLFHFLKFSTALLIHKKYNDESSSNNLSILLNLVNFQMIPRACQLENTLKSIEFSKVTSKYVY